MGRENGMFGGERKSEARTTRKARDTREARATREAHATREARCWREAPKNPTRGSGGASKTSSVGFGAKPQPPKTFDTF